MNKENELIRAARYGYDYHATTQFPDLSFDENCKNNFLQSIQSPQPSPLPESVEEPKDWTKPDENGDVDVPDYLMPLLNKLGFQLRFHTISGEGEAITLVRMTSIAERFFKTHNSAEVERLRNTLHKILRTPSKSDCDILASEALKEQ